MLHNTNTNDEFDLLRDISPQPNMAGGISTFGMLLIEASVFVGLMLQRSNFLLSILIWVMGAFIGGMMLFIPYSLKFKEVAGKLFIDSQTHFADDDIYELLVIDDIETVLEPSEPFDFAEVTYKESELADTFTHLNAERLSDDKIELYIKQKMSELEDAEKSDSKIRKLIRRR